jgi:hypothetical protein
MAYYFLRFRHRVRIALRAIRERSLAVSFFARAIPPFEAPSNPSATAAGFLVFFSTCVADLFRERLGMDELSIVPCD